MDYYVGEIRMFAGNYAPEGWALCDGRLLSVNQYQVLYSLLGVVWGGDGVNSFALPDLRGRLPVGQGQGTGLTTRALGQMAGTESVAVTGEQMPAHAHAFNVALAPATTGTLGPTTVLAEPTENDEMYLPDSKAPLAADQQFGAQSIANNAGAGAAHGNVMPSLALNFIIALQGGIYPSRPN